MSIDDESFFDDFGNYIGPVSPQDATGHVEEDHPRHSPEVEDASYRDGAEAGGTMDETSNVSSTRHRQQIVLHEEKKYYLSTEEVYGPQVETLIQDEDTQPLTEPIIAPLKTKRFQHEATLAEMAPACDLSYMFSLLSTPERIRNIAICGHLHHGKSSLLDVLMAASHHGMVIPEKDMARYMDSLFLERSRELSLKSKPLTLLLSTLSGASMVINAMDTPGHADFTDEQVAALRIVDGVVLVVDVVEGMMAQTEAAIRRSLQAGLPMVLILNKMERLFLELKLPPTDAYYKICHVLEEINTFVAAIMFPSNKSQSSASSQFSPEKGNVLFASTLSGWIFSLRSFAMLYLHKQKSGKSSNAKFAESTAVDALACRLWGEVYYQRESGKFWRRPVEGAPKRTFVNFILEPLYKLYGAILTEERDSLQSTLASLGIALKVHECGLNTKMVLRKTFAAFFGPSSVRSLISAITDLVPDPRQGAFAHTVRYYSYRDIQETGSLNSQLQACDSAGPLVALAVKTYPRGDATQFDVLVRVFSGMLSVGQTVRVVEGSSSDLGMGEATQTGGIIVQITGLCLAGGRYQVPIRSAFAGSWALVSGIHQAILKCATLFDATNSSSTTNNSTLHANAHSIPFASLSLPTPLMKVAIEPVIPGELPKMLAGLAQLNKTYPQLSTKVEDSGEHVVMGPGELYMDCVLHDLRHLYADIEVKVADPVARLAETVAEMSYIKCHAHTPNGRNRITIIVEPLERPVMAALEGGRLPNPRAGLEHSRELAGILQKEHGWDIIAARSVWAYGPDSRCGPSMFLDDTLPSETDKEALALIKDHIIQGFQWACREGPLCEEQVRGVKFRLIEVTIAADATSRAAGQLIPTVRKACHAAILTASPRLMEPMLRVQIQTSNEFVEAVYTVLAQRRGHVIQDAPRAGTPLYVIRALLPLMDSFGFETDLRIHTQGMAYVQAQHDHWQVVSGDPLDTTIRLIPLEPSPAPHLSRDFMVKTRRRKGLSEDVKLAKFFDEGMLSELAKEEALSGIKGLQI